MVSEDVTEHERIRKTVAIVDHDPAVRDSFSVLLDGAGYGVHAFESGGSLISSLPRLNPHCLLLEFHLPELNGLAVVDRLTKLGHAMPVVFMASHPERCRAWLTWAPASSTFCTSQSKSVACSRPSNARSKLSMRAGFETCVQLPIRIIPNFSRSHQRILFEQAQTQ